MFRSTVWIRSSVYGCLKLGSDSKESLRFYRCASLREVTNEVEDFAKRRTFPFVMQ